MEEGLGTAGEGLRHKAQLDERLHPGVEEEVEDAVDVVEGDFRLPPRHHRLDDDAHVVVKEAVEPEVLKAAVPMGGADMFPDVLPQDGRRVAAADAEFPVMGIGADGGV